MLQKGKISKELVVFINKLNSKTQTDKDKAIKEFSDKFEQLIYQAIQDATLTIPPGTITVVGSPSTQSNLSVITVEKALK